MYSDNKNIRAVADVAAKIMMGEKLHPNQQKLDVHEPEKDKLTADDFKKLRDGKKTPEVKKEEVEQIQEYESKDGKYTHKGTYGYGGKGAEYGETDYDKENELAKAADKPKKPNRQKYGARQNYVRSSRVNETFSGLLSVYKEQGLKGLSEAMIREEPDNEQFTKELEDNKSKAEGKKTQPNLAKGSVQAVKQEEVEIQVINADLANGVEEITIDEREMTEPEMKKREEIVKSMKKGMEGFKDRYGDRAKSVMYATATKQAMK
jgi:hypothetical protein